MSVHGEIHTFIDLKYFNSVEAYRNTQLIAQEYNHQIASIQKQFSTIKRTKALFYWIELDQLIFQRKT